jgi:hypothetical protein
LYSIAHSPNGWTDTEIAIEWIKDFDKQTKFKAAGETRVLLLDGHSSHHALDLLRYALQNGIVILGYPPHCTHALQGLDVVCFAKMKLAWRDEITRFEELHRTEVKKADFAELFGRAYAKAFSSDTIKAAFKATGIHPFNPHPSPVRRVMEVYHSQPQTPVQPDLDEPSTVIPDDHIDPALFTPSKQRPNFVRALRNSKTGSFLVATPKIRSSQTILPPVLERLAEIPQPDWVSLDHPAERQTKSDMEQKIEQLTEQLKEAHIHIQSQDEVIHGAHAQLIVQNLHLNQLNKSLNAKETRKSGDRTKLYPEGKGRMLTKEDYIDEIKRAAEIKKQKEEETKRKQEARAANKAIKETADKIWKERVKLHDKEVQKWKANCVKLRSQKVKAKDLPKKPKRPIKKEILVELKRAKEAEEGEDESEEEYEEDDESEESTHSD